MRLPFQVIRDAATAWRIRRGNLALGPALPPVAGTVRVEPPALGKMARRIRLYIACLLFFKTGRCFYRAFALAAALRRNGLPAVLNIGCRSSDMKARPFVGHCWVSLDDRPIGEIIDPYERYQHKLGSDSAHIQHWLGKGEAADT